MANYYVDTDGDPKCSHCGKGQYWMVIGPDGVGGSTSFSRKEDAEDLAEMLNDAYTAGLVEGRKQASAAKVQEDDIPY